MTRRIMVALDDSAASRAALESAVRLAAQMSAEIFGIFIEDTDIISAAGLPGRQVVSYQGASVLPLDANALMSSLRARARYLRVELERMAGTYRVPWRFETVRGRVSEEILRAAASSEMIALGCTSVQRARGSFGATALTVIERAQCSVLVIRRSPQPARIVVLTAGSARALEIGEGLARMTGAHLLVQRTPDTQARGFDILMRLAPSYLVIDRASLSTLRTTAGELGERLKLEGLIVTDDAAPPGARQ